MAVQVPRIERANVTSGVPKNDRINMNVKDQSANILQRGQDINQVVGKVDDINTQYENEKIDQLAYENEKDYTIWTNNELNKLKSVEGDPTKAYKDFDEAARKKKEDLLGLYPDIGGRVKDTVNARLNKTHDNVNIGVLKQRGMQQEVYANNVYESTVKLKKNSLPVVAGYIQAGDDSSFQMFDQGMNDIKTTIVKRGLGKGTSERLDDNVDIKGMSGIHTYLDDDGKVVKVKMTPLDQQRAAKEMSEGVKSSMETLIASGQIEEARMMQKKYKGYIDLKTATSLEKKFKTVGRKAEAYKLLGDLRGKTEDQKLEEIDAIEDEEVRAETMKIHSAYVRDMTLTRERKDKVNSEVLLKEASTGKYTSWVNFENSDAYKAIDYDSLSDKSQTAIREAVEQPKESSPEALAKANNLLLGNTQLELEEITEQELQSEYLVGLDKSDRNRITKEFNRLKNPTAAQERMTLKEGDSLLRKHLIQIDYIDSNGGPKHERRLYEMQEKLRNRISNMKVMPNSEQLAKIVKEQAASEIDDRIFNPKLFGEKKQVPKTTKSAGLTKPGSATISSKDPLAGLTDLQILNLKMEFKSKFKIPIVKSDPRFIKFVQDKG